MNAEPEVPLTRATPDIIEARSKWRYTGAVRPEFAEKPAPGDESVWDYPRPPAIVACSQRLTVYADKTCIADTNAGVRVLETAGAPTYYFPSEHVDMTHLEMGEITSVCEWKGAAQSITVAGRTDAAWRYVNMFPEFSQLYQWVSFYPAILDCFIGNEQASPQPGEYYGGWVTTNLGGPIKGEPGSESW